MTACASVASAPSGLASPGGMCTSSLCFFHQAVQDLSSAPGTWPATATSCRRMSPRTRPSVLGNSSIRASTALGSRMRTSAWTTARRKPNVLEKHFSSVIRRNERSETSSPREPSSSATSISSATFSGNAAEASRNFARSRCVSAGLAASRIIASGTAQERPFFLARDSRLSVRSRRAPTSRSSFQVQQRAVGGVPHVGRRS